MEGVANTHLEPEAPNATPETETNIREHPLNVTGQLLKTSDELIAEPEVVNKTTRKTRTKQ